MVKVWTQRVLESLVKSWEFYVYLLVSPATWLLYISYFGFPEKIPWEIPQLLSFASFGVFFVMVVHKVRGKHLNNNEISRYHLGIQLLKHTVKAYLCFLPFLILGTIILFNITDGISFDDRHFFNSSMLFILPFTLVGTMWLAAGYSTVILSGNSKNSLKNSFKVLKRRPLAILAITTIGLFANGFSYIRQVTTPNLKLAGGLLDFISLYFGEVVLIAGLLYLSLSSIDPLIEERTSGIER
jgi:hypothetical protein